MAITYTWKVTGIKTKPDSAAPDAIYQTYWEKIGTDENGNVGRFAGATPLQFEENDVFIPLAEVTEEMVIGWIQEHVVGDYEQHVNDRIAQQIAEQAVPLTDSAMPWAPVEE